MFYIDVLLKIYVVSGIHPMKKKDFLKADLSDCSNDYKSINIFHSKDPWMHRRLTTGNKMEIRAH